MDYSGIINQLSGGWYCYEFCVGFTVMHRGITQDPDRREREHRLRWPGGWLFTVAGPMTEAQARAWESTQTLTITPDPSRR